MEIKGFWAITDHGPIKWFLGFQIKWNQEAGTLLINQKAYIEAMVKILDLLMLNQSQCRWKQTPNIPSNNLHQH